MYQTEDRVYLNSPAATFHGKIGTILDINFNNANTPNPYYVQIDGAPFAFWFPEDEISHTPITDQTPPPSCPGSIRGTKFDTDTASPHDFDHSDHSGLGIGGAGRHIEAPIIPSVQALTRYEQQLAQATTCHCCRQTDQFDGVMFTTDPFSGLCDDCYG